MPRPFPALTDELAHLPEDWAFSDPKLTRNFPIGLSIANGPDGTGAQLSLQAE